MLYYHLTAARAVWASRSNNLKVTMAEKGMSLLKQRTSGITSLHTLPAAPTRIHLRSQLTGEYFAGPGRWTKSRLKAVSFESSTQAVYLVIQQRLRNIELLLASQDIPYEIRLPVSLPAACSL